MIASKNQITRQKNVIDMGPTVTMAVESGSTKATDELEISHNLNKLTLDERNDRGGGVVPLDCCLNEIELINESLNKLTNRLLTDPNVDVQRQIELNEGAFSFNSSSIAILESSPPLSSCSSSSSPSNLLNPNTADRLAKSNKSLNSTATSSSSMSVSPSLPSTTVTTAVSAKIATKEKVNKVKATKPNKYLVSTNSVPLVQPKPKRLANLIRLSNATFFSKSCPGEEMTEFVASNESTSPDSKTKSLQNDINTGTKPSKSPPPPPQPAAETTAQPPATVNHHHHQKITGKSLFSFATRTNKPPKKSTESNASSPLTSSSTSMNSPLPAHLLDDTGNSSTGGSTTLISYSGTINGYNVDVEKLARELILPSMNEPLTSYKTPMKPPLVTSKTIDATQTKKRSTFMRSLTQHK